MQAPELNRTADLMKVRSAPAGLHQNFTHPCPAPLWRRLYLAKGNPPSTAGSLLARCGLRRSGLRFLAGLGVLENAFCDRVQEASWLAESNVCSLPLANRIENLFSVICVSSSSFCKCCCQCPRQESNLIFDLRKVACESSTLRRQFFALSGRNSQ